MGTEPERDSAKEENSVDVEHPAGPPLRPEEFREWKAQKVAAQAAESAEAARKRNEDIVAGRVAMNGRELFEREPWVFDDARYVET